jgi:nitrite reductase/ring-hydroxylating ferredoxin subunit
MAEWSQTGEPLLNTRQKVLRNFWYVTLPVDKIKDGPKPFRLLGEDMVLFIGDRGARPAHEDRCCHRTARMSKGWIKGGPIVCGYRGWNTTAPEGSGTSRCFRLATRCQAPLHGSFHAREGYGHVRVASASRFSAKTASGASRRSILN